MKQRYYKLQLINYYEKYYRVILIFQLKVFDPPFVDGNLISSIIKIIYNEWLLIVNLIMKFFLHPWTHEILNYHS